MVDGLKSPIPTLDQMAFEIDPLGRKTQYTWCSCGSLAALIDPNGSTTSWTHDIEGRLITKTYADSSTYSYVYEAKTSNLKTRTDALGQKTNYFYCNDSRVCQTSYPNPVNPTAAVTNYWDLYFGRMTKTTKNDWGSYSYTYNNYVTSSGATPITGGGKLQLVHNDVIANSDITYVYDEV
jgi:YD repeat-containing protein